MIGNLQLGLLLANSQIRLFDVHPVATKLDILLPLAFIELVDIGATGIWLALFQICGGLGGFCHHQVSFLCRLFSVPARFPERWSSPMRPPT